MWGFEQIYNHIKIYLAIHTKFDEKRDTGTIEINTDDTYNNTERSPRSLKLAYPPLPLKTRNKLVICAKYLPANP